MDKTLVKSWAEESLSEWENEPIIDIEQQVNELIRIFHSDPSSKLIHLLLSLFPYPNSE